MNIINKFPFIKDVHSYSYISELCCVLSDAEYVIKCCDMLIYMTSPTLSFVHNSLWVNADMPKPRKHTHTLASNTLILLLHV